MLYLLQNIALLDIAVEVGKATAERLNTVHGNKAVFIKCDVSKEVDITSAFDSVLAQFKQIDVIINNAGIMVDAADTWRTASDVNWVGTNQGLESVITTVPEWSANGPSVTSQLLICS